jgi:hypothetical protein
VNAQGGRYGNALQAAVPNTAVVQLLIDQGADLKRQKTFVWLKLAAENLRRRKRRGERSNVTFCRFLRSLQ